MEPLQLTEPMLVSGIVLAVTFIGIFTENLHGFHRAKFAMMGAIMMIIAPRRRGVSHWRNKRLRINILPQGS